MARGQGQAAVRVDLHPHSNLLVPPQAAANFICFATCPPGWACHAAGPLTVPRASRVWAGRRRGRVRAWLRTGLRGRAQLHPPHPAPRPGPGGLTGAKGWAVTPPGAPPPSGPFPLGRIRGWGRSPPRSWVGRRHQQLNRAQRPLARTEKPLSPSHPHLKTNNNKMCPSVQLCGPGGRVGGRAGGDWAEGAAWGAKGREGRASPH